MNINNEIYEIKDKIEKRLLIINDSYKRKEYIDLCIVEENIDEKEITNDVLVIDTPLTVKVNYLYKLEMFYNELNSIKYLIDDINKDRVNKKRKIEILEILKNYLNNPDITLKEYNEIRKICDQNKPNKINVFKESGDLIIPKFNPFTKKTSPESFKKQFKYGINEPNRNYRKYDLSHIDFKNITFNGIDYSHTNFCYDLNKIKTKEIKNMNFDYTNLAGCTLGNDLKIEDSSFRYSNVKLNPQEIHNKKIINLNFEGVDLSESDFTNCTLTGTNLKDTNAPIELDKIHNDLRNSVLDNIDLSEQSLDDFKIIGGSFENTGVIVNVNRIGSYLSRCNLKGCIVRNMNCYTNITGTKLPVNNHEIIIDTDNIGYDLTNLETNGSLIIGSLYHCHLNNSNIKDSYAIINPQEQPLKDMSNGDYRGCIFVNLDFDGINTRGSKFDPEVQEIVDKCRNLSLYSKIFAFDVDEICKKVMVKRIKELIEILKKEKSIDESYNYQDLIRKTILTLKRYDGYNPEMFEKKEINDDFKEFKKRR